MTNTGHVNTIRLYGRLGARFGRVHHLSVSSAAEAVRALSSQFKGFKSFLTHSQEIGMDYAVFYGKNNLTKDELHASCGTKEIRFAPVMRGAKRAGVFSIIVGAVLVIVGAILVATGYGAPLGQVMIQMGWAMVIGGVIQLLMPVPKGKSAQDRPDNRPNYNFDGAVNTQAQGNPVPVLYGELIVGSAVISAGIDVKDQAYIPTTPGAGSGGGGGGGASVTHTVHYNDQ